MESNTTTITKNTQKSNRKPETNKSGKNKTE